MSGHDLCDLLLRWFHIIAGIMWIGNSMLFNWIDRNLVKPAAKAQRTGFQGEIWMVHSGGFYELEKKLLAPSEMPPELHWFKWQNFLTWASGISLLVVVYYADTSVFLVDPRVAVLSSGQAIGASLGVIIGAWLVYDLNWRVLGKVPLLPHLITVALLVGVTFLLCHLFPGRAAFIHVGVVIGTIMTGNVWTVILPSQRALIAATKSGRPQDPRLGMKAKHRSIHNNYLTFGLIFIMISNHFSAVVDAPRNWLLLIVIVAGGASVRFFMNARFAFPKTMTAGMRALAWLFPTATVVVLTIAIISSMTDRGGAAAGTSSGPPVSFAMANAIIQHRCVPCHSATPVDPTWRAAPQGVKFDTPEEIQHMAPRIRVRAVELQTMPLTNKTGITAEERAVIGRWIDEGAHL